MYLPGQSLLERLPVELLSAIALCSSPNTIASLALSCRYLNGPMTEILYTDAYLGPSWRWPDDDDSDMALQEPPLLRMFLDTVSNHSNLADRVKCPVIETVFRGAIPLFPISTDESDVTQEPILVGELLRCLPSLRHLEINLCQFWKPQPSHNPLDLLFQQ